ncbi:hypothetical protein [Roseomonas sp. WA12]
MPDAAPLSADRAAAIHDALTGLAMDRQGLPRELPPMPAVTALREAQARLQHVHDRTAQRDADTTLAATEAGEAKRAAETAELRFELGQSDGPELDEARSNAAAAQARAAELAAAVQVLRAAVPQAERAVAEAGEAARAELWSIARDRRAAAVRRWDALVPAMRQIAGELEAIGTLMGDRFADTLLRDVPASLDGSGEPLRPATPTDEQMDELQAVRRAVDEAARIADRLARQRPV